MQSPLVTIIVPVYNLAPFLPACIDSLLQQTYTHTEIIFVNDDSSDSSLEVLTSYQQTHKNIQVFSQTNAGPGPARNTGLEHATGEYILFVDGDDTIASQTVKVCVQEALNTGADIVCFGYRKVSGTGKELKVLESFEYIPGNFEHTDYISSFLSETAHKTDKINTACWGKLYKRSLIEDHRIRFRISIFEDSPFVLETICLSGKTRCIAGNFYNYFVREKAHAEKSITSALVSDYKLSCFYASDDLMKDFLLSKNLFDKYSHLYYAYHNSRVLLYGGYFEVYADKGIENKANWTAVIDQLKKNRHSLTMRRKGLYRAFRKRIPFLNIGAFISIISPWAAHHFFRMYEKTLAPR